MQKPEVRSQESEVRMENTECKRRLVTETRLKSGVSVFSSDSWFLTSDS